MNIENKKYHLYNSSAVISIIIIEILFWSISYLTLQYLVTNVEEFRFQYPSLLWVFLIIPIIDISWLFNRIWKNKALKQYASESVVTSIFNGFSNTRSILKFVLFRIGIGLVIIALTNPQYGENERTVESKGIDIMIALDVSKSMLAEDIVEGYNRLKIAKIGISRLLDQLHGDHVGIVVFAGEAYKQLPITPDYFVAKLFLKSIQTQMISSQGTDIGNAIDQCMSSFDFSRETNKAIVILSDGEDHEEQAIEAAKNAAEEGVVTCTIGMGSTKGVPIPIFRKSKKVGVVKDKNNETVLTKLNEENLISIAQAGDGTYIRAQGLDLQLKKILERIKKIEKSTLKKERYSSYDDQFQWFLIPGLLLLLLNVFISEKRGIIEDQIKLFK
ncbi:MAG: VWA domain-containing protein [Flavobacteriales bacterium]|nr:VWA domain-containing protein [Flavobacteriales bacterium]